MLMPFYTDHGEGHCQRVEEIVDQIVLGPPGARHAVDDHAFVPTPEEATYLLSAIWLHDIGMIYGIFPDEVLESERYDVGLYLIRQLTLSLPGELSLSSNGGAVTTIVFESDARSST